MTDDRPNLDYEHAHAAKPSRYRRIKLLTIGAVIAWVPLVGLLAVYFWVASFHQHFASGIGAFGAFLITAAFISACYFGVIALAALILLIVS